MRAEPTIKPEPKDVYKVCQWKWGVDAGSPWWKRFYFKHIFLRLLLWSLRLGIPTPKEVLVESDERGHVRRLFRWFEDEGIFESEEQAAAGCLGEHWGYCKLPYGRLMPPESAQYSGTIFPHKKNSHKWARPILSLVIKDRKKEERDQEVINKYIKRLHQALDR